VRRSKSRKDIAEADPFPRHSPSWIFLALFALWFEDSLTENLQLSMLELAKARRTISEAITLCAIAVDRRKERALRFHRLRLIRRVLTFLLSPQNFWFRLP